MITPLSDNVVVEPTVEKNETETGILLVNSNGKERHSSGTVLAVGKGRLLDDGTRVPIGVKPGDSVVFSRYSPVEIEVENKKLLIVSVSDLYAIITN